MIVRCMALLVSVTFVAQADVPIAQVNETQKILASDGVMDDRFGSVIVSSESYILIGAPFRDELDTNSGAVYVFDAQTFQELRKLVPLDGAAGDRFGSMIAIDGDLAVIGVPKQDAAGEDSGAAYVFDISTGNQMMKLAPSITSMGNEFGSSVAINDEYIAVGARHELVVGFDAGAVYVFDRSSGTEVRRIINDDFIDSSHDEFGARVMILGTDIYISALFNEGYPMSSLDTGTVFVYDLNTGVFVGEFTGAGVTNGDQFGFDLAVSGDRIFVSSGFGGIGLIWDFDIQSLQQLNAYAAPAGSQLLGTYGHAIDVTLSALVTTNPTTSSGGWADARSIETGQVFARFVPSDLAAQDRFGDDAATLGEQVLIGSGFDDDLGARSGSVYVFDIPEFGPCNAADFVGPYGVLNFFDVSEFIIAFVNDEPAADLNGDGLFDFHDVSVFLAAFSGGCP